LQIQAYHGRGHIRLRTREGDRLSLQQTRVKGPSYVNPTARVERQVKLEMLGKRVKGL